MSGQTPVFLFPIQQCQRCFWRGKILSGKYDGFEEYFGECTGAVAPDGGVCGSFLELPSTVS